MCLSYRDSFLCLLRAYDESYREYSITGVKSEHCSVGVGLLPGKHTLDSVVQYSRVEVEAMQRCGIFPWLSAWAALTTLWYSIAGHTRLCATVLLG